MPRYPQWSLSLRFPHQDPIHSPLLTHTRHMPSPSHFITRTILGEQYKSFSSSLCNLLHSPIYRQLPYKYEGRPVISNTYITKLKRSPYSAKCISFVTYDQRPRPELCKDFKNYITVEIRLPQSQPLTHKHL